MPVGALALSVALAIFASGAAHSPIAALLACLVAALAWRASRVSAALTSLAAIPVLLRFDPFLGHEASTAMHAFRLVLLFAGAMGVGMSLWAMARRRGTPSDWTGPEAPQVPKRTPSAERLVRDHALGRATERDAVERLLSDVRTRLNADELTLWLAYDGGTPMAALTVAAPEAAHRRREVSPSLESLAAWSIEQGLVTTNQPADAAAVIVAPVGHDDRMHGALSLYGGVRGALAPGARDDLAASATRLGSLLDLLSDGRETRHYRGKAELLARAAERVQGSHDVDGLGHAICDAALEVSGATRAAFAVWNEEAAEGVVVSVSSGHPVPAGFAVTADSFVGRSCQERQRFTIRDAEASSRFPVFGAGEPGRRLGSLAVVPLQREGRALGAIAVEGDDPTQLTAVEGSLLLLLSSVSAAAYVNMRQYEADARTDALTGLANRRVFDERLRQHLSECDRSDHVLSLILADVDSFKAINDTYGHAAGDRVLSALAAAAKHGVRGIDLCARYGGEELAILLPRTPIEQAVEVAERLRRAIESARIEIDGTVLRVTASFGVASYPTTTGSRDSLFSAADRALYEAKRSGRNCVRCAMPTRNGTGSYAGR